MMKVFVSFEKYIAPPNCLYLKWINFRGHLISRKAKFKNFRGDLISRTTKFWIFRGDLISWLGKYWETRRTFQLHMQTLQTLLQSNKYNKMHFHLLTQLVL